MTMLFSERTKGVERRARRRSSLGYFTFVVGLLASISSVAPKLAEAQDSLNRSGIRGLATEGIRPGIDNTVNSGLVSNTTSAGAGISLSELSQNGQHYDVMKRYLISNSTEDKQGTHNATLADLLAVANSAWALGLVNTARQLWDTVLAHQDFAGAERARTMLGQSLLELQEGNYEVSRRTAELASSKMAPSPLRAQLWLVIGEALNRQGAFSQAESYYKKAVEESSEEAQNESRLLLGECQLKLGLTKEARFTFTGVKEHSQYAPKALRRLLELDLQERDFEGALTWISEGTSNHTLDFNDPWISYAQITSLLALNRVTEAGELLAKFKTTHSENNSWYMLANAGFEGHAIAKTYPRARLLSPGESWGNSPSNFSIEDPIGKHSGSTQEDSNR